MLLAPSVECLQRLFLLCETELNPLGLTLNERKTVCMRVGPRYQVCCVNIVTLEGHKLDWVQELRYLGVYIVSSCKFKCCFDNARKSFYRSFNAIFGRIGRAASEEVVLSLILSKCLPVLLYGVDACPMNATDKKTLEFTVNRTLMKIFRTSSIEIIDECRSFFAFSNMHTASC